MNQALLFLPPKGISQSELFKYMKSVVPDLSGKDFSAWLRGKALSHNFRKDKKGLVWKTGKDSLNNFEQKVLAKIPQDPVWIGFWVLKEEVGALNWEPKTFSQTLHKLWKKKLIRRVGKGRWTRSR